jgi:hypothetical protein
MNLVRVVIALFSMMPGVCLGQSPRDIARVAFRSVVLLEMSDADGQPLSLGSGFFVSPGIIATNAHVIEGAAGGTAKLVGDIHRLQILGTVAIDRRADLALLKVSSVAPALRLEPHSNPVVGDSVYVVGNPLGLEGTFSEGIVSGLRAVGSDSILQMTAPISPGSSGGPVMNQAGAVIGVAEATFSDGQNLNLAVPVDYLSTLCASVSSNTQITPLMPEAIRNHQGAKSIVDGIGERTASGVTTSNFGFRMDGYTHSTNAEFRLINKLPTAVSHIHVRIIYYDAANSVMDFEDYLYIDAIPPGLTKTVEARASDEADRARIYYGFHHEDGSQLNTLNADTIPLMAPRVELRVVDFRVEGD